MKIKCVSSFYVLNKGVFDIGTIVEFDEELARKLIKQGVAIEYIDEQEKEEVDYSDLTVKELKQLLEEKGLSTKGKKAELIERLKNN